MTEILNNPMCYDCDAYGLGAPTGIVPSAPGELIADKGKITLVKDVPKVVSFKNISVLNGDLWIFFGIPTCYNSANEGIGHTIYNKTGTGFTVVADENSTFDYTAVKL